MTATPPPPNPLEKRDPREEFNALPAYVRDRLLAFLECERTGDAARMAKCNRNTIRRTRRQYSRLMVRLLKAQDERFAGDGQKQ